MLRSIMKPSKGYAIADNEGLIFHIEPENTVLDELFRKQQVEYPECKIYKVVVNFEE